MIWTNILETHIPRPCFDRPLVCDGNPDSCVAIIIGENPATDMQRDWWDYWHDSTGFDYTAFMDDYRAQRLELGKSLKRGVRANLTLLRSMGLRAVETNTKRNQRFGGAGAGVSNTELLNALIDNMPSLKAIIAHGKLAQLLVSSLHPPKKVKVFEETHFRSISHSRLDQICKEIGVDT